MATSDRTTRIRELNDEFRQSAGLAGKGHVMITSGVDSLGFVGSAMVLALVARFDDFWVYDEGLAEFSVEAQRELGLIGNGPDVLTQVSMVGNDRELDAGVGTCGKDGQSVPVGVGQPTLKVDQLTVGGTAA